MSDPMDEGKLAAANGLPLSENPYKQDTEEFESWAEGWHFYHDVDEDGELRDDA